MCGHKKSHRRRKPINYRHHQCAAPGFCITQPSQPPPPPTTRHGTKPLKPKQRLTDRPSLEDTNKKHRGEDDGGNRARTHAPLKNYPVKHGAAVHLGLRWRSPPRGYRNDVPGGEAVVGHRRTADGVSFYLEGEARHGGAADERRQRSMKARHYFAFIYKQLKY